MKKALGLLLMLIISCEKQEETRLPKNLRPDFFRMEVNGENWEPDNGGCFVVCPTDISILYSKDENDLSFFISNRSINEDFVFSIRNVIGTGSFKIDKFTNKVSIDLNEEELCLAKTRLIKSLNFNNSFFLEDNEVNNITLTRFDTINRLVCGKFELVLKNNNQEKKIITNGDFKSVFTTN